MKTESILLLPGLLGPLCIAVGGITVAITGETGSFALAMIWIGLLALLLFFYINFSTIKLFISKRSTQYGANMAVMIIVFITIIGLLGMMSVKYKLRVDLTKQQRYSLSKQTVKILKSLQHDVEAIAFYRSDGRTRQAMYDLLKEYSYYSPKFSFWFIDPDKKPIEAAKYGVTAYRTTLVRRKNHQEIVGFESEDKLTNALMKVIRDEVKTIYFVKGHGENNIEDESEYGYKMAKQAIEKENYQVRELLLAGVERIPDEVSVLMVSGPQKDFIPSELKKITDYIARGGRALFMLDPALLPELSGYLKGYGFDLRNDIIVDKLIRIVGTNYLTPVVTEYKKEHPITSDLINIYTFFPIARSVEITENPTKGKYNLAKTSSSSWARSAGKLDKDNLEFDQNKDMQGPLNIMAVSMLEVKDKHEGESNKQTQKSADGHIQKWGKIIVIG
ncbi:MAG: GldG family protein, partial [Gammaproteobacteria bacterium]|nr:GldG family protein [Gammaproteobacteria bacterium]